MPQALNVITGQVTAPGATLTALTMNTGDSATIQNTAFDKPILLLDVWAKNQVAGTLRIRSPKLHDFVNGIRFRVTAADVETLYSGSDPRSFAQKLFPQDPLTIELSGSGVAGQIEEACLLIFYTDLPGVAARLTDSDTLMKNGVNETTAEFAVTAVATGQYGGQVSVSAATQALKANTDYAIRGMITDTRCSVIAFRGPETGNIRVGAPGEPAQRHVGTNWFQRLSFMYGIPLIPVFNFANAANSFVDLATDQAGGSFIITLSLVEMQPGTVPGAVVPPKTA